MIIHVLLRSIVLLGRLQVSALDMEERVEILSVMGR